MIRNDLANPPAISDFTIFAFDRSGIGGNGGSTSQKLLQYRLFYLLFAPLPEASVDSQLGNCNCSTLGFDGGHLFLPENKQFQRRICVSPRLCANPCTFWRLGEGLGSLSAGERRDIIFL